MKTFFFDLDGVLIDTEVLYSRFWREAAAAYGYTMSYEESLSMRSLDSALARQRLMEKYGGDVYDELRNKRKALMEEYRSDHPIRAKEGAAELLNGLSADGIDWYIVTASTHSRAERYMKDAGLPFDAARLISTKSVERGKPFPEVYLSALALAGVDAADAIAVEDSPNGIRSARAAGLYTIMVPDLTQPTEEDLSYCDRVCGCLKEIREMEGI